MTGKQTFTDVVAMWKLGAIVAALVLFIGIVWIVMAGDLPAGVKWGVFIVLLLIAPLMAFLGYNLTTHRTVSSDLVGCEVNAGKNWGSSQTDNFKWNEVTGTGIGEQVVGGGKNKQTYYYFGVGVNGKEILLLRGGTKDFDNLMAVAAERTPQLPYLWIGRKDVNNRQVLQEVGAYCKVARS
jgi:hypothetical protein